MFATMTSRNFTKHSDKLIMDRMKKVMAHRGFAVSRCWVQAKAGLPVFRI